MAARVRTVAAMRAAAWRLAPRWRALFRQRLARVQASCQPSTAQLALPQVDVGGYRVENLGLCHTSVWECLGHLMQLRCW